MYTVHNNVQSMQFNRDSDLFAKVGCPGLVVACKVKGGVSRPHGGGLGSAPKKLKNYCLCNCNFGHYIFLSYYMNA